MANESQLVQEQNGKTYHRRKAVYTSAQTFAANYGTNKDIDIRFEIAKIKFTNKNYAILQADVLETKQNVLFSQNQVGIKGNFINPRVGDIYWGRGKLSYNANYGFTINVKTTAELIYPRTRKEIIKYFVRNVKGFGKVKATKLVDYFGENVLRDLKTNPELLNQEIPGLHLNVGDKKELQKTLKIGPLVNKMMTYLKSVNISENLAFDLLDAYGASSYNKLKDNPYIIADIKPSLWSASDRIFYNQLVLNKSNPNIENFTNIPLRYRTAIKYYLKLALDNTGSLAVKKQQLLNDFTSGTFLNKYSSFENDKNNYPNSTVIETQLNNMVDEGSIVITTDHNHEPYVYMSSSYFAEQKIIKLIRKFNKTTVQLTTTAEINDFIAQYEQETGFILAKNQRLAVDLLVNNKISILTGGPGTGKTQTLLAVREFVSYLKDKGIIENDDIAYLAPTGKASRRMSEVLGIKASTIHRKLKLRGFGNNDEPEEIKEDFIIVDETSMIDVDLFSKLLSSLHENAHILLVGDENQLPSVGAGLILRDLIESNKIKTVILTEVFRQKGDSVLITNASKMKDGIGVINSPQSLEFKHNLDTLQDSYFIQSKTSVDSKYYLFVLLKKLTKIFHKNLDNIMILSAQRKGILGTIALNEAIQEIYNPLTAHKREIVRKDDNCIFREGDKVMQIANDYQLDVFNGEIGIIDSIEINNDGSYELNVLYSDHPDVITYTGGNISEIQLAYAITIHKSQGSESPIVIQFVDKSQHNMLNRSLVYTGYTRTRNTNFIIGQKSELNYALQNTDNLKRSSLIKEKL